MDKKVLKQYIDACELVKETEEEIKRIRSKSRKTVQDSVKGSSHDFPYTEKSYHMEGTPHLTRKNMKDIEAYELLLRQRKADAEEIKHDVEAYINTIPQRMQRIIKYRIFEGMPWGEVAERMGRRATEASVKMEFKRFMENK